MGNAISKTQCPECAQIGNDNHKDNLVNYEDGSAYCFACGYHEKGEGDMVGDTIKSFKIKGLQSRGLSERTCKKFGYGVGVFTGNIDGTQVENEPVHVASYCDTSGNAVGSKLRTKDKKFKCIGNMKEAGLFGQHLYESNDKVFLTICEGEIDAMSVAQVMGIQFPVVSIPTGAGPQTRSIIKKQLDWISGFKHVVFCFDNDDAGRKAIEKCADLFPVGKLKIAKLPRKDANEMLMHKQDQDLKDCIWQAQTYRPDSVLTIDDVISGGLERPEMGLSWPWPELTKLTYGINDSQLIVLGAGTGVGKTTFLQGILYHLAFHHHKKIGIISLEQTPRLTALRLAGSLLGKRLHVPSENVEWDEGEIHECLGKLKEYVYIYDHFGGNNTDNVLNRLEFMVRGLGCDYIILDHITKMTAHVQENKVNAIDDIMAKLSGIVHELGCTIFAVSHLSKPPFGHSYEEGAKVSSSALRGSQAIQQYASFIFGLERNKASEDEEERNTVTLRILKDRFSGESDGKSIFLEYNKTKDLLVSCDKEIDFSKDSDEGVLS